MRTVPETLQELGLTAMRFLVVTEPRAGTQMLYSMLAQHPKIVQCNHYLGVKFTAQPGGCPAELRRLYAKASVNECAGSVTHIDEHPPILADWRELRAMHSRIIILIRRNRLRRYLSLLITKRDGLETAYSCDEPWPEPAAPMQFGLVGYEQFTAASAERREAIEKIVGPYLSLTYEDLRYDRARTMNCLWGFLGLPAAEIEPTTYIRESRPITEIIANWSTLAADVQQRLLREDKAATPESAALPGDGGLS